MGRLADSPACMIFNMVGRYSFGQRRFDFKKKHRLRVRVKIRLPASRVGVSLGACPRKRSCSNLRLQIVTSSWDGMAGSAIGPFCTRVISQSFGVGETRRKRAAARAPFGLRRRALGWIRCLVGFGGADPFRSYYAKNVYVSIEHKHL